MAGVEGMAFAESEEFGMLTSCPSELGTGMRASARVALRGLTAEGNEKPLRKMCKKLGVSVQSVAGPGEPVADGLVEVTPTASLCMTEGQTITKLYRGVRKLKADNEIARS